MLIGISGKMQSGKDTVGLMLSWLLNKLRFNGYNLETLTYNEYEADEYMKAISKKDIHKFADSLRECISCIIGLPKGYLETDAFKNNYWIYGYSGREWLQKVGQALRDAVHPDIWVDNTISKYKVLKDQLFIITDVRYLNEFQTIKLNEGYVVRVIRNFDTGDHESETSLDDTDDWDAVIVNNSNLEHLFNECKKFIESKLFPSITLMKNSFHKSSQTENGSL